jgi:hypothetical protein
MNKFILTQIVAALAWAEKNEVRHGGLKFRFVDEDGNEVCFVYGAAAALDPIVNELNVIDAFPPDAEGDIAHVDISEAAGVAWEVY